MHNLRSQSFLVPIIEEIYHIICDSKKKVIDPWIKISEIDSFREWDDLELDQFIYNVPFLTRERWNHISVDKIEFILGVPQVLSYDIKQLADSLLDFQGFEKLIGEIISEVGYYTTTNFRFSDHSEYKRQTSQERYEIDVIGLKRNYLLLIDAKEWHRRSPFSSLNEAANRQYQRSIALKNNSKTLMTLLQTLLGSSKRIRSYLEKNLPFKMFPIMVTLEDNNIRLNEKQVPLVSIHQLNCFLNDLPNNLNYYRHVSITDKVLNIDSEP